MNDEIEVEKSYSNKESIAKLRRLADAMEQGESFEIQIAGKRIYVPPTATVEFEYEHGEDSEQEMEIEVKWKKK